MYVKTKNGKLGALCCYLLTAILLVLLCLTLISCGDDVFEGEKIADDDCFSLDYTIFNGREEASLTLIEGDVLKVVIAQESGFVDMTVAIDGQQPVYEGNNLTDMTFTLNITSGGTYRVTVSGHSACGTVSVKKSQKSRE